jgi:hypothetical protein
MKSALRFLPIMALALVFLGMAQKPPGISVRFYAEANKQDSETFASPVSLKNPVRDAYIEKIPTVTEREFRAIFPFRAPDGTWGCAFKLDSKGRLDLEMLSSSRRGSALVPIVATKTGNHQIAELLIDRPVRDGIISIPAGLTDLEMAELTKTYPVIGEKGKNAKVKEKKKEDSL